jgi:ABC-type glycerol-3-phosphate transport system substrate-binding protein
MAFQRALLVCLLALTVLTGCSETKEEAAATTAATTTAARTDDEVRNAVWERSYSECATAPLDQLAAKYNVERTVVAVSTAVANAWTERFGGADDAIASGVSGCRQGFQSP